MQIVGKTFGWTYSNLIRVGADSCRSMGRHTKTTDKARSRTRATQTSWRRVPAVFVNLKLRFSTVTAVTVRGEGQFDLRSKNIKLRSVHGQKCITNKRLYFSLLSTTRLKRANWIEMKNLNIYQKTALAIAALIILIIQLIKFADEGIDGASWILSFAISALLFIPILSDAEDIIGNVKSKYFKKDEKRNAPIVNSKSDVGALFKSLGARAEKLHKFIAEKSAVKTIPMFNVISDRWFPSIAAAVVLAYGVVRKCDDQDYYESEEFKKLNGMLFNLLMSLGRHQDKLIGGAQSDDEIMRNSMSIISNARKAADLVFSNLASNLQDVDLPLHKFIQTACGFTDDYYIELHTDVRRHLNGLFVEFSHSTRLV
jgi:hypothetical protein